MWRINVKNKKDVSCRFPCSSSHQHRSKITLITSAFSFYDLAIQIFLVNGVSKIRPYVNPTLPYFWSNSLVYFDAQQPLKVVRLCLRNVSIKIFYSYRPILVYVVESKLHSNAFSQKIICMCIVASEASCKARLTWISTHASWHAL